MKNAFSRNSSLERTRPNKAPEPTITAVTFRAPSSTERASRDRGSSLTLGKTMYREIPEADWRYLRSLEKGLLEELARRINNEVRETLAREDISEHEKRGLVFGIVHDQDKVVAACFDDWRRSRMFERCVALHQHGLLKPQHIAQLTEETQALLKILTG